MKQPKRIYLQYTKEQRQQHRDGLIELSQSIDDMVKGLTAGLNLIEAQRACNAMTDMAKHFRV